MDPTGSSRRAANSSARRLSTSSAILLAVVVSVFSGCDSRTSHVSLTHVPPPVGGEILTVATSYKTEDRLVAPSTYGVHALNDGQWLRQPGLGLGTAPPETPVRSLQTDGAQVNYPRNHLLAVVGSDSWVITEVDDSPRLLWSDSNGARWQEVPLPFSKSPTNDTAPGAQAPVRAEEPPRLLGEEGRLFLVTTTDIWRLEGDEDEPRWKSIGLTGLPAVSDGLPPAIRNYLPPSEHRPFELVTLLTDQLLVYRRTSPDDPWVMTSTLANVDREILGVPDTETVFVVTSDSLHRTDDQGERWFRFWPENLPSIEVAKIIPSPGEQPGHLVIVGASDGSIWVSRDGATTWKQTRSSDPDNRSVSGFAVSGDYSTIWASTLGQGILRSTDGGESWSPQNEGLHAARPLDARFSEGGDLLVATRAGLHRLNGEPSNGSWAPLHTRAATALQIDDETARVISGTSVGDIVTSIGADVPVTVDRPFGDRDTFEFLPLAIERTLVPPEAVLAIDQRNAGQNWLAWSRMRGAAYSSDSGASWEPLPLTDALVSALSNTTVTQSLVTDEGVIFLVEESPNSQAPALLWRSTDRGQSWTTVHAFSRDEATRLVVLLDPAPGSSTLFAAHGARLSRSMDGGETWERIPGSWEGRRIVDMAVYQNNAALLLDSRRHLEVVAITNISSDTRRVSRHRTQVARDLLAPDPASVTRFDLHGNRIALVADGDIWMGTIPERRAAIPRSMELLATIAGAIVLIAAGFLYTRMALGK